MVDGTRDCVTPIETSRPGTICSTTIPSATCSIYFLKGICFVPFGTIKSANQVLMYTENYIHTYIYNHAHACMSASMR